MHPSPLHIRPYVATDHDACLRIFRGNMPKYFTLSEEADFIRWLDGLDGSLPPEEGDAIVHYFVVEREGAVVGCGGWGIRAGEQHATLIWGMVDGACHRQGIGAALTTARLAHFRETFPHYDITIDTSHHTAPFYERFGFVTEKVVQDGYAPGLHRHDMRLRAA